MLRHSRIVYLLCILICVVLLTACGKSAIPPLDGTQKNAETPTASTTTPEKSNSPSASPTSPSKSDPPTTSPTAPAKSDPPTASPTATVKPDPPTASPTATVKPDPPTASPTAEPSGVTHVVEIVNFAYASSKLTIKAGDSVKFINKDEMAHTATADDKSFDTGLLAQNNEFVVTFNNKGEFSYYCTPHPGMTGLIIVEAK